ncbi:DUF4255 domain-containing protein [bacterium]|nr:DUF4255 domain-containing protein [bacterium]
MIDKALLFLAKKVNQYFDAEYGPVTEDRLTVGNITKYVESDGGNDEDGTHALLTLVNLEEDRMAKNPENFHRTVDGIVYRNPKILLNVYALFTAIGNTYTTSLETISLIIRCFQGSHVFESSTEPDLDASLEKLSLELCTLNFEQVNHLWSTLGGKYLPSVLYKVRVVGIEDTGRDVEGDLIREVVLRDRVTQPK